MMKQNIYLDTHVVVWLYEGHINKISTEARQILDNPDYMLYISPMVVLELQYLCEINKITVPYQNILGELQTQLSLATCNLAFAPIAALATQYHWTRDPFDRLITANTAANNGLLITKDDTIRQHFPDTIWD